MQKLRKSYAKAIREQVHNHTELPGYILTTAGWAQASGTIHGRPYKLFWTMEGCAEIEVIDAT